jgi:transposase-like protein
MILSPYSRQKKAKVDTVYYKGIFYEKKRKTHSITFKKDMVHKYLHEGWSQSELLKHFCIHNSMLHRWGNHYQRGGIEGLKEKRRKAIGTKNTAVHLLLPRECDTAPIIILENSPFICFHTFMQKLPSYKN